MIFSPTISIHLDYLLTTHHFVAKLSKCIFVVPIVNYLGHAISAQGVAPDSDKVQAILDCLEPHSLIALHSCFGLTSFYRKFVCHYATLVAPLTDLLGSTKFSWNTNASRVLTE